MAFINPTSEHDPGDLREQNERLRTEVMELRREADASERGIEDLCCDMRTLLTPISGYLQAIARRRPLAQQRPVERLIDEAVLPRVTELTRALDRLTRPPIHWSRHR